MEPLPAAALAERTEVTTAEVGRLVALGILAPRDGVAPFLSTDVKKVRLAKACERAGLPMEGIASVIREGRLSFAFLDAAPYRRWALRSTRSYRQVSEEAGISLELLRDALEAMGFAPAAPDDPIREDELETVPLVQLAHVTGIVDRAWMARVGRGYAEGMRRIARVETEVYHARFEGSLLEAGADQRTAMERASEVSGDFAPLADRALMGIYRRQQELAWTEHLVEDIENELEAAGVLGRPERVPAMCFLDLVGYTRLTEERGDQAAAELAGAMSVLVQRSARDHDGVPVKWLGDGVMFHFREPAGAVLAALRMVRELPEAGLPPAHVGVAAGPVVAQGGDYFGRTVNVAARIAARAGEGQVLVSGRVAEAAPPPGVAFVELGELALKGIPRPVRVLEARPDGAVPPGAPAALA
jgi:adenylate cyclase